MDRKSLSRATDSSDAPTPGYLYLDIAKSASISPKACQDTVQYLLKRLQNKNHNVKFKTLKVIAKVAENPATRGQFKQLVCTNPQLVGLMRDASTFRGPPDPLRGMAIYERVHEAAKETLSAIYSDAGPSGDEGGGMGMAPGMGASYGNPVSTGGNSRPGGPGEGSGAGASTTRMEGIGNPNYSDPRSSEQAEQRGLRNMTVTQVMGTVGETVVNMVKDPLARNVHVASAARHSGGLPGYGNQSYGGPPGRNELSAATNGQWTMASNRGPGAVQAPGVGYNPDRDAYQREKEGSSFGWAQQPPSNSAPVAGGGFASWGKSSGGGVAAGARDPPSNQFLPQSYLTSPTGAFGGTGGTAISDGSYERNLIAELCPPGGMKAEPPQDKLEQFARSVPKLNADLVCPVLLDSLEDGTPWIVKAKALCVIDRTIRATSHMQPNPYADFFHACAEEVQPLTLHARAAIRDPAKRVMNELGLEKAADNKQALAPPKSKVPVPPAVEADLLDFCGILPPAEPVAPPPAAAPPAPALATMGAGGSLFGGLTVQDRAPTELATAQPFAVAPDPPVHEPNLLGDYTPASSESQPPVPIPATTSVAAPVAPTEFFGNMSVKENVSIKDAIVTDAPASLPTGSGFSFMNNGPASGAAASTRESREQPATSDTPPKQDSFDPLLNLDWSDANAKQSQMQAIAAQHNMMMMQQQQAQMRQMAMQQHAAGISMQNNMHSAIVQSGPGGTYVNVNSPSKGNVMRAHSMKQIPILGQSPQHQNSANAFSFLRDDMAEKKKQQEHSFDFIKDAMKTKK